MSKQTTRKTGTITNVIIYLQLFIKIRLKPQIIFFIDWNALHVVKQILMLVESQY